MLQELVSFKTFEIRFRDIEDLFYRSSVLQITQYQVGYLGTVAVSGYDISAEFSGGFRIRLRPASRQDDDRAGVLSFNAVEEEPVLAVRILRDGAAVYDDDIGVLKTVCSIEAS